jgi:hypothetical protein
MQIPRIRIGYHRARPAFFRSRNAADCRCSPWRCVRSGETRMGILFAGWKGFSLNVKERPHGHRLGVCVRARSFVPEIAPSLFISKGMEVVLAKSVSFASLCRGVIVQTAREQVRRIPFFSCARETICGNRGLAGLRSTYRKTTLDRPHGLWLAGDSWPLPFVLYILLM